MVELWPVEAIWGGKNSNCQETTTTSKIPPRIEYESSMSCSRIYQKHHENEYDLSESIKISCEASTTGVWLAWLDYNFFDYSWQIMVIGGDELMLVPCQFHANCYNRAVNCDPGINSHPQCHQLKSAPQTFILQITQIPQTDHAVLTKFPCFNTDRAFYSSNRLYQDL